MNSPSNNPSDDDRVTRRLDDALALLRREEPDESLRRDAVLERIMVERAKSTPVAEVRPGVFGAGSRRWAAAAAVALVAGGAAISTRWLGGSSGGAAAAVASSDPLLANAASVIRALATADSASRAGGAGHVGVGAAPDSSSASFSKSLQNQSALLLAATRAAADQVPVATERARLLRDVEYVLAQVVQGAAQDDVERELTLDAVRNRRLLDRIGSGALQ